MKSVIWSERYNPVADERAVILCKKARFTVLTSRLIRMEWSEDGVFEDHSTMTFIHRKTKVPQYSMKIENDRLCIDTGEMVLYYDFCGERQFSQDNLWVEFEMNKEIRVWRPGTEDTGNLGGTNRSLDWWEGAGLHRPLSDRSYVMNQEPMSPGLLSRNGWTLIDDSQSCLFDGSNFSFEEGLDSPWPWVMERPVGVRQDFYLFTYGHDYRGLLADYVKLSGRIALPPRYVFGVWWTRYTVYRDQEIRDFIKEFRSRGLPLDVFMLDLEWHRAYIEDWLKGIVDQSGRGIGFHGYSWNRLLFPEPEQFFAEMHRNGIHIGLNLHPSQGVQPHEDEYQAMCMAMGRDPGENNYIPLDITDKVYCENNMKFMHHPTDDMGNDFWWNDHIDGNMTKLSGLQNITWMNYVLCSDQARRGKRPMAVHRWGGLGSQRYPVQFSGDVFSCWETLRFEVEFTGQAANSCAAYWSHDIGGHYPGPVEAELYTRWLQFGTYAPIMRTHCSKNPQAERLIWAYPEPYASVMRQCYLHRQEQILYLYTEARRAYDTGVSPLHQMYLDYPEEAEAYCHPSQYFFGQNLIAAPVTSPLDSRSGLVECTFWVPPGHWYDLTLGRLYVGPQIIKEKYLLKETPLLQKAGSVIPLQLSSQDKNLDYDILGIRIAPAYGKGTDEYLLYEDDGYGREYSINENICITRLSASWTENEVRVEVESVLGDAVALPLRCWVEVILPGILPPDQVFCCDRKVAFGMEMGNHWWYDGHDISVHIRVPLQAGKEKQDIYLVWETQRMNPRLCGVTGALSRLVEVYTIINRTWPAGFPADSLIEAVQTGQRMALRWRQALTELDRLYAILPQAIYEVSCQGLRNEADRQRYAERVGIQVNGDEMQQDIKNLEQQFYRSRELMKEAAALLDV